MKKFRTIPLILIVCLLLSVFAPGASALTTPEIDAKYAILIDMNTGDILYSKNPYTQTSPASLTKIMTVLLAVEAIESGAAHLEDRVVAQADCRYGLDEMSSTVGIQPGEELSLEDLLYCAMVHSANESCNIIASYIGGSISGFVEMMNAKAAQLGCTETHFMNTNGLTEPGHYSTAYDLALIASAAMKHDLFVTICNTPTYIVPETNMYGSRTLFNSNALISTGSQYGDDYIYNDACGVKTGYTSAAGNCLISTAQRGSIRLLSVVMGCSGPNNNSNVRDYMSFIDTPKLFDWVFDNFRYLTVVQASQAAAKVEVEMAAGDGTVTLRPQNDVSILVPAGTSAEDIKLDVHVYEERLTAPISSGTILATADIVLNGTIIGSVNLITPSSVELSKSAYLSQQLAKVFSHTGVIVAIVVVLVLLAAYLVLVMRYRALRRRHLKARAEAERRRAREREEREAEYARRRSIPDEPTQRFATVTPEQLSGPSYEEVFYRELPEQETGEDDSDVTIFRSLVDEDKD